MNSINRSRGRRCAGGILAAALLAALMIPTAAPGGQPVSRPKLTVITTRGQVQMQFQGQSNQVYEIEASTNLVQWTVIAQRAGGSGPVTVADPSATPYARRFYRAVPVGQSGGAAGTAGFAPDKILVKPKAGLNLSVLNLTLGVNVLSVFPSLGNLQVVKVPASTTAGALITDFQQSGQVQYAEPDFYVHVLATPDDQYYPYLWAFHNTGQFGGVTNADIDAQDAWDIQHDASNIIVAVVDTGVRYTHEDLAGNMWHNPEENQDGYTNDVYGINVTTNGRGNGDPWDDYSHGTHVAGIIGAVGDNLLGVAGVAWHVQIMACKFLDASGNGTIDDAITCLNFARTHGANIVNASWGANNFTSQALHDAIASLRDAGIMFVAAAGNGQENDDVASESVYPASYSDLNNVIAVAATDPTNELASFSAYGATNVDLGAPGVEIGSCWNGSDSDYQYDDGTSMAAAIVSGAVAIMEAHFPNETYQQIKQQILANVNPLPTLQGKCLSGGQLNLYKALTGSAPPPSVTASFTANPTSGQAPLAVQFTDKSSGSIAAWDWNFGDGSTDGTAPSPSHTYGSAGNYTATLTVTGNAGQSSSASQTIVVTNASSSGLPVINLTATQPDAYAYTNGTQDGIINFHRTGDPSQTYQVYWTFSGTASNGVDYELLPTNSAFPAGTNSADLTITPLYTGSMSNKTVIVTLASGPAYQIGPSNSATVIIHGTQAASVSAGFTASPTSGQAPLTVQFTDESSGPVTAWSWDFGDGETSTSQSPSHTYNSAGNFTARLTVSGSGGQSSTVSHTITVTNAPSSVSASFTASPSSGQAPLTVQFTDHSSGPVTAWSWDFGDGATSTSQSPSHTYSSAGNFTAKLTVSGSSGQSSTVSQTITVTNAAASVSASFTASPSSGEVPLTVQFTDHSSGPVTAWSWDFGDGATSTSQSPSHTYGSAGSFTATLTVSGGGGQSSTVSHTITVTNAPTPVSASFTASPTSGQAPLAVQFTDHSSGPVTAWSWDFGDGVTSTSQSPSHTYSSAGSFTATLTVTGSGGQTSSTSQTITATNAPAPVSASFTASPTSGQAPLTVQFTDHSSGPVTAWNWDFGDGATSTGQSPSHTYSSAGSFTATLTVTGSSGQSSTVSHTITVNQAPVSASFTASPSSGQAPLTVQFTDHSSGPVTAWSWDFGDGATSTSQSPSHTYSSAGSFTATLTVTSSSGQSSTVSHTITVNQAPSPTVTVEASQPIATSLTPGIFSISRTGDESSALTVDYSLGGTAQNGTDYQSLSGVVTIPAGASTATVSVQPLGLLTILKTVVLTVSPESNYSVGLPASATVTIVASLQL